MVVVDSVALLPDSMINLGSCWVVCERDGWGVVDVLFRCVSLHKGQRGRCDGSPLD